MIRSTHQKRWEKEYNIVDIWRKKNPDTIGTTWTNGVKDPIKRIQTRIDRVLADKKIINRITNTSIIHTKISDHDAVSWNLETKINKRKIPYNKIPTELMKNEIFTQKVKEIYEEEREGGIDGYERFKKRCIEASTKISRGNKRKSKKIKQALIKRIEDMRKIIRWAESANIQEENGRKIKRRKRGIYLIKKSNPTSWLGQTLEQTIDLQILEEKASTYLDKLIDQRDELNERKRNIRSKIAALQAIKEGERIKPSFFQKMKTNHKKEEIYALIDENDTGKETRVPEEIKKIATKF